MSNIISKIRRAVAMEDVDKPKATEVIKEPELSVVDNQPETVVQKVGVVHTIKVNDPGKPLNGFTTKTLADELGLVISQAMHKAGLSSIESGVFGILHELDVVPTKYFYKVEDEYVGKTFYVLNNSNRMTALTRSIYKAVGNTNSDVVSFPYMVKTAIELPHDFSAEHGDFTHNTVKVDSLYLTPKEIEGLNFQFIKTISFCERIADDPESIDLVSMAIDRAAWKAAPYRE